MVISTRRLLPIALLTIGLVGTFLFLHDNTDRSVHSLRTADARFYMAAASNPELSAEIELEAMQEQWEIEQWLADSAKDNKNSCLKDPSKTGTVKEQLQNFVEGDCAPMIIVPGIMGTKLVAEIDCKTLQVNHPEIMEACGWSTCEWSLFKKRPDTEYLIWIPDFLSPVSMISLGNATCFGRIIGLNYDQSQLDISQKYQSAKGVTVNWYGNTPKTYQYDEGGFGAISDLLPLPIQVGPTKAFRIIADYFTNLGYQKGLSLFAIPYDFRHTPKASSFLTKLDRTIRYAHELTGKKVVIAAHSLGNLNTLGVLLKMTQEDKDRMIATYVALTPPFGGSSKTARVAIGGEKNFLFLEKYGTSFFNQKSAIGAGSSIIDLLPGDSFYRFRNETWMKDLLKRIELEKIHDPNTARGAAFWQNTKKNEIPYSFFPDPSNLCFKDFADRPAECRTVITDLTTEPVARIRGEAYYANYSSMRELMTKHSTIMNSDNFDGMLRDSQASDVYRFPNPNVPIVYIYGSHLKTELTHEWDYYPAEKTRNYQYAFPTRTIQKYGDGTVEVSYSLPIALKWAWEHLNGTKGAKPIKVAEYCSRYNRKATPWDGNTADGSKMMNKTEYISAPCSCWDDIPGDGGNCKHNGIVADRSIIEFLAQTIVTKQKVARKQETAAFILSNRELIELMKALPHLRKAKDDISVRSWLNLGESTANEILIE